jgi:hypothetical protein
MNATYLELSVESGRNCEDVYRQIVEQIIDAKYAYEQSIHSDIKVFLFHDSKQMSVYLLLFLILNFICSLYYSLIYFLTWKLFLESLYNFCDEHAPPYILI